MAGGGFGRIYGGVGTVLLQKQRGPSSSSSSSQPLDSFFISGSSSSFLGSSSMVSFEDVCGGKRSKRSLFQTYDQEENLGDEDFEDYFHQPEKKRRLSVEQVRFLEKSFETENKLEPERKVELAKELGLQPRQVAIWFQNRRARWKTKRLEKDFDTLQANYNSLKADYDNLIKEKENLQAEVVHLTDKLLLKEKDEIHQSELPTSHNEPRAGEPDPDPEPIIESGSDSEKNHSGSAKSDVIDSDSPHNAEPGDSSYAFEADHSDISQDDQDYLISKSLLPSSPPHAFEDVVDYPPHSTSNSCNFDLPPDDHSLMFWPAYWDINPKM